MLIRSTIFFGLIIYFSIALFPVYTEFGIDSGHYIHFKHFCAVLGCEHAPYNDICPLLTNLGEIINPFPILHKDDIIQIENIINSDNLLSQRDYSISQVNLSYLLSAFNNDKNTLLYGDNDTNGYPITEILKGAAYIIANDNELFGKRPKNYIQIIESHLSSNPILSIELRRPDLLTPLIIAGNGRGAMIGAKNPRVYETLISHDDNIPYKIIVRDISEEDLRSAE